MTRKGENIFYRKDGRWEARYVRGYQLNGKCQYGYVYGKSYQEAKTKRVQLLLSMKEGEKNKKNPSIIRFNNKIDEWLERQKITVKVTTYSYYCNITSKHIRPELGSIPLCNIDENTITRFVTNKLEENKLKTSTVKGIIIILKQILSFCDINIKIVLPKVDKSKISVLTKEEKTRLEKYIFSNINKYTTGILLSLYAGLRIGEVCALKWENVDFKKGIISIEKTVSRINNEDDDEIDAKTKLVLLESKTVNSIRQIPINPTLIKLLARLKQNSDNSCFVLTSNNKFMDPRNYYNQYKKILKECGIVNYKYHTLRHTFATNCIELGLDPKSLSEILGYSDIKITLSLYVHPEMETKRDFMNKKLLCCDYL